jgi:hypothetical protein
LLALGVQFGKDPGNIHLHTGSLLLSNNIAIQLVERIWNRQCGASGSGRRRRLPWYMPQIVPIGNAEFVDDVVQMVFDHLLADEHLLGHFPVCEALGHQSNDFPLALAECGTFALSVGGGAGGIDCIAGVSSWATNCRMTAAVVCESSQISPSWTLRIFVVVSERNANSCSHLFAPYLRRLDQ